MENESFSEQEVSCGIVVAVITMIMTAALTKVLHKIVFVFFFVTTPALENLNWLMFVGRNGLVTSAATTLSDFKFSSVNQWFISGSL